MQPCRYDKFMHAQPCSVRARRAGRAGRSDDGRGDKARIVIQCDEVSVSLDPKFPSHEELGPLRLHWGPRLGVSGFDLCRMAKSAAGRRIGVVVDGVNVAAGRRASWTRSAESSGVSTAMLALPLLRRSDARRAYTAAWTEEPPGTTLLCRRDLTSHDTACLFWVEAPGC